MEYEWIKNEGKYGKRILKMNGVEYKIITRETKYDGYFAYEAYKNNVCVARGSKWRIFLKRLDKATPNV